MMILDNGFDEAEIAAAIAASLETHAHAHAGAERRRGSGGGNEAGDEDVPRSTKYTQAVMTSHQMTAHEAAGLLSRFEGPVPTRRALETLRCDLMILCGKMRKHEFYMEDLLQEPEAGVTAGTLRRMCADSEAKRGELERALASSSSR